MKHAPVSLLRDARYAFPALAGRFMAAPGPVEVARLSARLARRNLASAIGYFHGDGDSPEQIVGTYRKLAALLGEPDNPVYLALKAPALDFDPSHLDAIAEAGIPVLLDAITEAQARATLAFAASRPGTGVALPARWHRSLADAWMLRDGAGRIRLVKGEWADPGGDVPDIAGNFLALAGVLAGRTAPVAVATHDPQLAAAALELLKGAGTPCELEQLRGLPSRRSLSVAARLGVPARIYCPFGPGWWPYAIDKALARPYLPVWAVKDLLG